jgi:predicted nuclease of predicted toxin-antitoxin system
VKLWLDAHLPPGLCPWLHATFAIEAQHVRDLGLRHASDLEIFRAAKAAAAAVMTKDLDFPLLQGRLGSPPQIIWITGGNTTALRLQEVLGTTLRTALGLLEEGEPLVEISCRR